MILANIMSYFAELCFFKKNLPYAIKKWNQLDSEIRNAEANAYFRKMTLNFKRSTGSSTYKIYDPLRMNLLNRYRLGFTPLSERKFKA